MRKLKLAPETKKYEVYMEIEDLTLTLKMGNRFTGETLKSRSNTFQTIEELKACVEKIMEKN
jgi:hypothetical protein